MTNQTDQPDQTDQTDPTDQTDQSDAPTESEFTAGEPAAEDADGTEDAAETAPEETAAEEPGDGSPVTAADRLKQLESEGDIAADYLEELLDIADLDGDLDMDVEGDRAAVSIVGADLGSLVGEDGQVLESLQELTRLAVYRETGERSRLMLDIGGYRADVRKSLVLLAEEAIDDVRESGEAVKLAPMSPFERKVVHDAVAAAGLRSESEGVEPTRCVVIHPAD
jgi:spoIIIJ-associated protein